MTRNRSDHARTRPRSHRQTGRACRRSQLDLLPLVARRYRRWPSAQTRRAAPTMRKINIGVSVAPPNVVHTAPYVAKALGFFAKRCIDANIIQFEGGQSRPPTAAAAQGSAIVSVSDVAVGRGMKVQQIWGLAPRMPQAYVVQPDIKTAAGPQGQAAVATGGGVGGFNWRMGREVLKTRPASTSTTRNSSRPPTAGRLPGLIAGQIDAVALHPEDVFLAKKQKPSLNLLVQLAELMPQLHVQRLRRLARLDRARPRAAARCRRRDDRGQPHDVPRQGQGRRRASMKATEKPKDAVEYAIDVLTKNCVWSVNGGFDPERTAWTIDNSAENGDIEQGQEADGRAGRQFRARQGGGRSRRRPRHHRQLQGLSARLRKTSAPDADPGRRACFREQTTRKIKGTRHEHPDAASRRTPELGGGAHASSTRRAVRQHARHAVLPRRIYDHFSKQEYAAPLRGAARQDARAQARRRDRARRTRATGASAAACYGSPAIGNGMRSASYVLVPLDGEPTLIFSMGGTHAEAGAARMRQCADRRAPQPQRQICRDHGRAPQGAEARARPHRPDGDRSASQRLPAGQPVQRAAHNPCRTRSSSSPRASCTSWS